MKQETFGVNQNPPALAVGSFKTTRGNGMIPFKGCSNLLVRCRMRGLV